MLTIHLQNLEFKSFHGLYAEEKILGNIFIVNVTARYQPSSLTIIDINQTVNYEDLFALIEKKMVVATELLETLAIEIATDVLHTFAIIDEVNISITKQHPPIKGFKGNVAVSFNLNRRELL